MRSRCGSTETTRCGTTPARRHEPSAPSTATTVPVYPLFRRRARLSRRCRLGPAPTTTAESPSPSTTSPSSRIERSIRGRLTAAFSRPTPAMRSKVAASSRLAIRFPRSIRLAVVALPEEALLAHEADAAAEARERLPLELVGRVGLAGGRLLDDRRLLLGALQELFLVAPPLERPRASASANCSRKSCWYVGLVAISSTWRATASTRPRCSTT